MRLPGFRVSALVLTVLAVATACGSRHPSATAPAVIGAASRMATAAPPGDTSPSSAPINGNLVASTGPVSQSSGTSRATPSRADAACSSSMLRIAPGPPVVPGTSENAEIYKITNAGRSRCTTDGYPDIRLRDAAQRSLRFAYQDGGGAYVTRAKPALVRLAPGSSAYLLVAQEECPIATNARPSTTIAVRIPGQHGAWLTTKTRTTFGGFARCPGGGPGPNTISISPISRNFRALP